MESIFTKIVKGEIPCYKIAETETCLAFLDINPLAKGHALVIPKREVDYIFDLDDELYCQLMKFSKKVGRAVESVISCKRMGMIVFGLDVPHAHVHLIPINLPSDMSFSSPKLKLQQAEFSEIAGKIKTALDKM